jgi:hypothetical protein
MGAIGGDVDDRNPLAASRPIAVFLRKPARGRQFKRKT